MLNINKISKSYGKKKALSEVTLELTPGIYGLLGPNGAGKSTLMNILTDNLLPDSGVVTWEEKNIFSNNSFYRKILGYAPQQQGLYETFSGRRFLTYMAALKEIPKNLIKSEVERTAGLVNMTDKLDSKIRSYSGGMKQRLLVAQALMGNPKIIILDEPTAGLDPKERVRIRTVLNNMSQEKIIIVATHVVSDVESVARDIILLKSGEIVAMNTPELLVQEYAAGGSLEDVYMKLFGGEQTENDKE